MKNQVLLLSLFSAAACTTPVVGPHTNPHDPIISAEIKTVLFENLGGGYTRLPAPGSECTTLTASYTLTLATHTIAFQGCFAEGEGAAKRSGTKTLDAAAWAPVQADLDALRVGTNDSCIADLGALEITVTDGTAQQTYKVDASACKKAGVYFEYKSAIPLQQALDEISK